MFRSVFGLTFFLFLLNIFSNNEAKPTNSTTIPKLLIVSYDGFRYDYFDRKFTPFLKKLKLDGTFADYMRNVFVTKTFPNHQSISTGLYSERHGVIDSEFYDKKLNKTFKYSPELYHYKNDILPIWTLNEKSAGGRHSGTMMWPGANFDYNGTKNTFSVIFNVSVPWENRINDLITWFKHPETPINLGMLYIEEPDYHGHAIGINSDDFNKVLGKVDLITKYLHDKLKENSLEDVNVVHLSDHGMATVTMNRIIDFKKYINPDHYSVVGTNPVIMIYPHPGKNRTIYRQLKLASERTKQFDVYLKRNVPKRYHFSRNPRIGPIVVVAKLGYGFESMKASFPWYEKEFNITINEKSEFGVHGYDNLADEMHPFFFGMGPAFKSECKVLPFDNVDLLPLFCDVLNLECHTTNRTVDNFKHCLTKYEVP